jgi:hypothetical protein
MVGVRSVTKKYMRPVIFIIKTNLSPTIIDGASRTSGDLWIVTE